MRLVLRCVVRIAGSAVETSVAVEPMAALAITRSREAMLGFPVRSVLIAAEADVGSELSRVRRMSLLVGWAGSEGRERDVSALGDRIQAITL